MIPVDSKIPTLYGYEKVADLVKGRLTFDNVGMINHIHNITSVETKDVYEVELTNSRKVLCDKDQLWDIIDIDNNITRTVNTEYIANNFTNQQWGIPTLENPVDYDDYEIDKIQLMMTVSILLDKESKLINNIIHSDISTRCEFLEAVAYITEGGLFNKYRRVAYQIPIYNLKSELALNRIREVVLGLSGIITQDGTYIYCTFPDSIFLGIVSCKYIGKQECVGIETTNRFYLTEDFVPIRSM